jgi:hypothetical protein
MRKLISFVFAIALLMGLVSVSFAGVDHPNMIWAGGHGRYNQPPVEAIRVRYGLQGAITATIESGSVMVWDTTSSDGFTVLQATTTGDERFAGVMLEDLLTNDTSDTKTAKYALMAVKGYCLASIDAAVTVAATNTLLTPGIDGGFRARSTTAISYDCAQLLQTSGAAGSLYPVYIPK